MTITANLSLKSAWSWIWVTPNTTLSSLWQNSCSTSSYPGRIRTLSRWTYQTGSLKSRATTGIYSGLITVFCQNAYRKWSHTKKRTISLECSNFLARIIWLETWLRWRKSSVLHITFSQRRFCFPPNLVSLRTVLPTKAWIIDLFISWNQKPAVRERVFS